MKTIWIQFTREEFHALFDYLGKLKEMELPETAKLVVDEIYKLFF